MDTQKNLLQLVGDWLAARQDRRAATARPHSDRRLTGWLPSRGNVIFTLAMIALLVLAQSVGALPLPATFRAPEAASTGTIAYQGRLADAAGAPITDTVNMTFRLYTGATGGTPLWSEPWTGSNGVKVSDGLFNVMLGSLTALPQSAIAGRSQLFLGITVGTDDEMQPRVQLGSVPFAVQALTVPDGSVTTAKIADGAVTTVKIANNAITSDKLNLVEGNIGIGTINPTAKLDVRGGGAFERLNITDSNGVAYAGNWIGMTNWVEGTKQWLHIGGIVDSEGDNLRRAGIWANKIFLAGKVGVGTLNPAANLDVVGDFHASGTKSAVVQTDHFGQRKLYAIEAPDVHFSDEGMARLQSGVARVELDPIFLETIEGEYLVHVTPYGDASLYVAEIGQDYFVVKAREGDPNVAFAWRLSATRKGYAGVRLEEVGLDHEAAK